MIEANNPNLKSWVNVPEGNDFPIQNLPFGIFSTSDRSARPGVAIGEFIIDLQFLSDGGYLEGLGFEKSDFTSSTLNPIINRGKAANSCTPKLVVMLKARFFVSSSHPSLQY